MSVNAAQHAAISRDQSLSPRSTRAIRCIATVVARSRTAARSPGTRVLRVNERTAVEAAGLPVGDREADQPDRLLRRAATGPRDAGDADADRGAEALPRAVGQRLCDLDRDGAVRGDQLGLDADQIDLGPIAVDDRTTEHVCRRAGRSVRRAASKPPVQDSARPIVSGHEQRRDLVIDRAAVAREQVGAVAARDERPAARRSRLCASGENRVETSISPRRRQVVISSAARSRPAASAARSVFAISASGMP